MVYGQGGWTLILLGFNAHQPHNERAEKRLLKMQKTRFFSLQKETTYVYVDEFHRWKVPVQQDSLLKALEVRTIRFIGSTTENPYLQSITQ